MTGELRGEVVSWSVRILGGGWREGEDGGRGGEG